MLSCRSVGLKVHRRSVTWKEKHCISASRDGCFLGLLSTIKFTPISQCLKGYCNSFYKRCVIWKCWTLASMNNQGVRLGLSYFLTAISISFPPSPARWNSMGTKIFLCIFNCKARNLNVLFFVELNFLHMCQLYTVQFERGNNFVLVLHYFQEETTTVLYYSNQS